MKEKFVCSFIYHGLVGGILELDDEAIVYKCNKLTIPNKYKHLLMSRFEIKEMTWNNLIVSIHMNNDETYKFLVFNKSKFIKAYENK